MKKLLFSLIIILFSSYLVVSCKNNFSSEKSNGNFEKSEFNNSNNNASQLYSEGMKMLNHRISVQSSNKEKALELNKQAIEKFVAAYKADTSFIDAVMFASECTLYGKDYHNCYYWTSILKRIDTSQQNKIFCGDRIEYCNKKLKLSSKK